MVKMKARSLNLVIIQVYAPTSAPSIEEIEKFYEEISKALDQVSSQDMLVVTGDLNAKIGQDKDGTEVGKFGLGERNKRGDWRSSVERTTSQ